MSTMIMEMSQMSDSQELYHSRPPAACVAFLYTVFAICIFCIIWIYAGQMNVVIKGNAEVVTEQEDLRQMSENRSTCWIYMSVSSCEVQWVEPGMTVICSIGALPASEYGYAQGQITEISPDLYLDENGQGYYRIKVRLDRNTLTGKNGREVALQMKMTGEAKILAGTQRVLTYLQNRIK